VKQARSLGSARPKPTEPPFSPSCARVRRAVAEDRQRLTAYSPKLRAQSASCQVDRFRHRRSGRHWRSPHRTSIGEGRSGISRVVGGQMAGAQSQPLDPPALVMEGRRESARRRTAKTSGWAFTTEAWGLGRSEGVRHRPPIAADTARTTSLLTSPCHVAVPRESVHRNREARSSDSDSVGREDSYEAPARAVPRPWISEPCLSGRRHAVSRETRAPTET
jgi:hypothetical protein